MKTIRANCAFLVPFPADPGMTIHGVPDALAAQIVALGNGVIVADEGGEPETVTTPLQRIEQEWEPVLAAGPEGGIVGEYGGEHGDEFTPAAEPKEPKRPYGNATKAAWVEWAVHVNPELTEEEASAMSKNQLMAEYGERLLQAYLVAEH